MRADELIQNYSMEEHVEHGLFIERHYESVGSARPASGSIYYYVAPGERTEFHRIDCDEYWCYNAGSCLELWVVRGNGRPERLTCGPGPGAEPCIRLARGDIFAARLPASAEDGAFITCITVPRFSYQGFELLDKALMLTEHPETEPFWLDI